jgi:hypothetical protein
MRKWVDLQFALQLGFSIAMTIHNSLHLDYFLHVWVLLDKLQELQHMQLAICEYVYICKLMTIM